MASHTFPVNIGPKHYTKDFQLDADYAKSWKSVLDKAYGSTHAQCCCPGRGDRKLAIKRRDGTDSYHLARFAGSGPEHTNECRFYAPAPETSGMQTYDLGVVEEGDAGNPSITLADVARLESACTGADYSHKLAMRCHRLVLRAAAWGINASTTSLIWPWIRPR